MSYSETIHYLYNLQKHGIKFGLNNISRLMSALENPHRAFTSIHVSGTNGKGSTSAIIAAILKASGLKVGLFTSPHLLSFTERIRVDNEEITEYEVVNLAEEIREKISNLQSSISGFSPTFFEVVTAMAFLYFRRKKIDIAVIEVGMGGRLDATNIIIPETTVITSIGHDHREFLGNTLREIAYEKAGIIKDSIPVVVSSQSPDALEVIEAKAEEKNARVYLYGRDFSSMLKRDNTSGIYFDYSGDDSFIIHDLYLPLVGEYQMQNASAAIKAIELFYEKLTSLLSPSPAPSIIAHHFIREGLKNVKWPGRLEIVKTEPIILIDGAHNADAALALSYALKKNFLDRFKRIILVLGIMGDKDIEGIMKPLLPLATEIILTSPDYERAASPAKLVAIAVSLGFSDVHIALTVKNALELAINICQQSNPPTLPLNKGDINNSAPFTHYSSLILVTGSFYTIGEAKEFIGHKGVLTRLRE
jgi:dihydrofolate synthase/folylpolyglutamate synthase